MPEANAACSAFSALKLDVDAVVVLVVLLSVKADLLSVLLGQLEFL